MEENELYCLVKFDKNFLKAKSFDQSIGLNVKKLIDENFRSFVFNGID